MSCYTLAKRGNPLLYVVNSEESLVLRNWSLISLVLCAWEIVYVPNGVRFSQCRQFGAKGCQKTYNRAETPLLGYIGLLKLSKRYCRTQWMQKSAVWEMKMQMDRCYGNHFAPPVPSKRITCLALCCPTLGCIKVLVSRNQTRQAKTYLVSRGQIGWENIQEIRFSGHTARTAYLLACQRSRSNVAMVI